MHSRRSGATAATTSSSSHRNQHRSRAFDERDEELFKKRSALKPKQRRRVVKITVTPSRIVELFLIVLLGWFVYDNYRSDKTAERNSLIHGKGEKVSTLSNRLQTLFFFRNKYDDEAASADGPEFARGKSNDFVKRKST